MIPNKLQNGGPETKIMFQRTFPLTGKTSKIGRRDDSDFEARRTSPHLRLGAGAGARLDAIDLPQTAEDRKFDRFEMHSNK